MYSLLFQKNSNEPLFLAEGLTIRALILSGVCFVGAYQNAVQRAVICITAVICALRYSTFDTLIGVTVHKKSSFQR